jgi:hypothetical protein
MSQPLNADRPAANTAGNIFQYSPSMRSSLSTYLTVGEFIPFRNEPDTICHRIFGELCLAGLAIISLIEAVARTIFAIPATLISCCLADSRKLMFWSAYGALFSAENFFNCLVALVANICLQQLVYDDLIPCFVGLNEALLPTPPETAE